MYSLLEHISSGLEWLELRARRFFVVVALLLYAGSLIVLTQKVNPASDLDTFLVKALSNLSIPFGVILFQELLELLSAISRSALHSTCQQFEIVALVILRSFFKDFYKLNKAVAENILGEPVQSALVKVVAILAITFLIFIFKRLSQKAGIERRDSSRRGANLWKQAITVLLCLVVFIYMLAVQRTFNIMAFISLVFTGMIVVDAVFFLWSIGQSHEFDMLMFDGGLVVSLILARFPLFASNKLSYALAIVGVGFATAALRLFVRPMEQAFLGRPSEDSVSRLDMSLRSEPTELKTLAMELNPFMQICQASEQGVKAAQLVSEELLAKFMTHMGPQSIHTIDIGFAIYKKLMTITVSTAGDAYNPLKHDTVVSDAPAEQRAGGLGMHIVRMSSDQLAYRREAGCNIITVLLNMDTPLQESKTDIAE